MNQIQLSQLQESRKDGAYDNELSRILLPACTCACSQRILRSTPRYRSKISADEALTERLVEAETGSQEFL